MVTASYMSPEVKNLHEAATNAGVTILNEVGLDPGNSYLSYSSNTGVSKLFSLRNHTDTAKFAAILYGYDRVVALSKAQ